MQTTESHNLPDCSALLCRLFFPSSIQLSQDFANTLFLPTNAAFTKAKINVDSTDKVRLSVMAVRWQCDESMEVRRNPAGSARDELCCCGIVCPSSWFCAHRHQHNTAHLSDTDCYIFEFQKITGYPGAGAVLPRCARSQAHSLRIRGWQEGCNPAEGPGRDSHIQGVSSVTSSESLLDMLLPCCCQCTADVCVVNGLFLIRQCVTAAALSSSQKH